MSIIINDNIQSNSPKSLDNKYMLNGVTPYVDVTEVNSTITLTYRSRGLTVLIGNEEYWYKDGITDVDLVEKASSVNGTVNYIARFTPNGKIVGNSEIYQLNTDIGIGTLTPSAKLHVSGVDATASNFALRVENIASSPIFVARNDGNVGIGVANPTNKLDVLGTGNTTATIGLNVSSNNTQNWFRVYDNGTIWSQGDANNTHLFASYAGNVSVTYDSPSLQYLEFKVAGSIKSQLINQNNLTRFNQAANQFWGVYGSDNNPYILFDETNKLVGIAILSPTARLHVRGVDATASNFALTVENLASVNLLQVRNDGVILMNSLPTSSVGLPAGALWNNLGVINIV